MVDGGDRSLRHERDFVVVLGGQAVSALGDAVTLTAVPLLVLALTGSGALMGVVGALQFLPDLLLGLVSGAVADRYDRRRVMAWADGGRAVLTALVPLAHWVGAPTMTVLLVALVPINALRVVSDAALQSSLPLLVGRERFPAAAGWFEATMSVPFVAGPALAGVLVAAIGPAPTLAIDAASFAVSAVAVLLVRRALVVTRTGPRTGMAADVREGLRFVRRQPVLLAALGFGAGAGAATAGVVPALAYYVTVDADLDVAVFGYLGSSWSLGYLVASAASGKRPARRPGARMAAGGVAVGGGIALAAASTGIALVVMAAAVIGAAVAVVVLSSLTLRTSVTPDELLGRVGSTAATVSRGVQPAVLLGVGALLEATTGRTALLVLAAVVGAGSLWFATTRAARVVAT